MFETLQPHLLARAADSDSTHAQCVSTGSVLKLGGWKKNTSDGNQTATPPLPPITHKRTCTTPTHPEPAVPASTPTLRHGVESAEWRHLFLSSASYTAYLSTMNLLPKSTGSR
ncbi:hypothetical protein JZ751_011003 [Albula glossodonta]|uniref:Uncharacterized protein n=1 Tax=Albula glossodonta TaxID=121402 RepID=A0A8T2NW31_9TELE|nr:hypothetical protein JZ751_011003 [Albula glossodonta]